MTAARGLYPWHWLGVPMLQALAATLVFAIPIRVFGLALPEPIFPMAAAFAWAVIRPSVLAPICVLIMGLFLDLLWGGALGFWPVCLLLGYGVALAGRTMLAGQSRGMMWTWYGATIATAMGAGYLFVMFDVKAMPSLVAIGWQFLATMLLYPFSHRLIEMYEDADVRFR